jgi:hypothetical protein
MKKENLTGALMMVTAIYPSMEVTSATIRAWEDLLEGLEDESALRAFKVHLKTSRFPPTPADIISLVKEMEKSPADKLTSDDAWHIALGLAANLGYYGEPLIWGKLTEYPKVAYCIRTVGFANICHTDYKDLPYLKKQFLELYDKVNSRELVERKLELAPPNPNVQKLVDDVKVNGGGW